MLNQQLPNVISLSKILLPKQYWQMNTLILLCKKSRKRPNHQDKSRQSLLGTGQYSPTYMYVYTMKKSVKHFIGQIMSLHDDIISVKFLKSTGQGKFVWPEKEDTDMLQNTTIAMILPQPEMDRHGILSFSKECLSL